MYPQLVPITWSLDYRCFYFTNEPIYLQIVKYFKQQMVIGHFKPGDEIPSRRELAGTLKVNANTVQRAYKEMEDQGMIETVRNFQSTITSDTEKIKKMKYELIDDAIDNLIVNLKSINVDKDDVINILNDRWK